jgi:hypothetical protein
MAKPALSTLHAIPARVGGRGGLIKIYYSRDDISSPLFGKNEKLHGGGEGEYRGLEAKGT